MSDPTGIDPEQLVDPRVGAARQLVADMFQQITQQLPDLLQAQQPSNETIPKFTDAMLRQLQEQLNRALGLPAKPDGAQAASAPQSAFEQEARSQLTQALAALKAPGEQG